MPASPLKRFFRHFGIEFKRTAYGLDPWLDIAALLKPAAEPIVLDVGANAGQTAQKVAAAAPSARIWSFEPNAQVFEKLVQNVAGLRGVTPVNAAVGASEKTAKLNVMKSTMNSSLLEYVKPDGTDSVDRVAEVQVRTIDEFADKEGLKTIHLLKTDTQGYDSEVLKGAARMFQENRIQAVFVEVIFTPTYQGQAEFEQIYATLRGHGLYLSGFYNVVREKGRYMEWADALFVRPEPMKS